MVGITFQGAVIEIKDEDLLSLQVFSFNSSAEINLIEIVLKGESSAISKIVTIWLNYIIGYKSSNALLGVEVLNLKKGAQAASSIQLFNKEGFNVFEIKGSDVTKLQGSLLQLQLITSSDG